MSGWGDRRPSQPPVRAGEPLPVVAIGDAARIGGFAVAGVQVHAETEPERVRACWHQLPSPAVVLLTGAAADALGELADDGGRLTVVVPT